MERDLEFTQGSIISTIDLYSVLYYSIRTLWDGVVSSIALQFSSSVDCRGELKTARYDRDM